MERRDLHCYSKIPNSSSGLKLSELDINSNCSNHTTPEHENNECTVREQDRFMPIANVIRIMRKILPPHAKISDDAKETIQECVSEYISFITGEANERCQGEQRKTITAEDVLWAMSKLGFDDYIEPLTVYLHRYREMEGDRAGSMRGGTADHHHHQLAKRMVDHAGGPFGVGHVYGTAPNGFLAHHHGFLGFLKDASSNAGGSSGGSPQAAIVNGEPYASQSFK